MIKNTSFKDEGYEIKGVTKHNNNEEEEVI
jgi:hypothetical protein